MDEQDLPVKQHRSSKLETFLDQLGRLPDREIAALAGCTVANVYNYRMRHNIPLAPAAPVLAEEPTLDAAPRRTRASRLDRYRHLIGKLSDAEIARIAKCSSANVSLYRRKHNLSEASPAPDPVLAPDAPPFAALYAYALDFEDDTGLYQRIITAPDLPHAFVRALQATAEGRRFRALRVVGPML